MKKRQRREEKPQARRWRARRGRGRSQGRADSAGSRRPEAGPGRARARFCCCVGRGRGAYFMGVAAKLSAAADAEKAEQATPRSPKPAVFYDLPDMLVNLNSPGERPSFLKLSVSLELDDARDRAAIEAVLPRIIDSFQIYLRELRDRGPARLRRAVPAARGAAVAGQRRGAPGQGQRRAVQGNAGPVDDPALSGNTTHG